MAEETRIVRVKESKFKKRLKPIFFIIEKLTIKGLFGIIGILLLLCIFLVYVYRIYIPSQKIEYLLGLIKEGNLSKFQEKFEDIRKDFPDKVWLYNALASQYLNLGMMQEAEKYIFESLNIQHLNKETNILLSELFLKYKRYNDAEEIVKKLVLRHPYDKQIWLLYAKLLYNTKRPRGAISCIKRALGIDKKYIKAYELLQKIYYYKLKDRDKALLIHRKVFDSFDRLINPGILNRIIQNLIKEGKINLAKELAEEILKYSKDNKDALYSLSFCLYKEGRLDEAYFKLINSKYKDWRYYALLGKIDYKKARPKEAEKKLLYSLKLKKNSEALEGLADIYYENKQFNKAKEYYILSQNNINDNMENNKLNKLLYKIGLVEYKLSNFKSAEELFSKILDLNYRPQDTIYNLSCVSIMQNNLSKAEDYISLLKKKYKEELFRTDKRLSVLRKNELYYKLSELYNNLGTIELLRAREDIASSLYLKAIEFANLAKKENTTAVSNMQLIFRGIHPTKPRFELLCDVYKIQE